MTIEISSIGSFYVGGREVDLAGLPSRSLTPVPGSPPIMIDPNGRFVAGQMYAQFVRLARPRHALPVALWHGGGLTGSCWETTPDGRPGWLTRFLKHGFDVLICDAVERGRAGWARYPQIFTSEPVFMPPAVAWEQYRIGPADGFAPEARDRRPFPQSLFPAPGFDDFVKQIVPRWMENDGWILPAYRDFLEHAGPLSLIAHSQGAAFAIRCASERPDLVKRLVLLEPGGVPELSDDALGRLGRVPILIVWGDFIEEVGYWRLMKQRFKELESRLCERGAAIRTLDLPAMDKTGNSHLPMMDANSDDIADLVAGWIIQ
jgi:pimeloyl-ACP methyl ester carboxylesterase